MNYFTSFINKALGMPGSRHEELGDYAQTPPSGSKPAMFTIVSDIITILLRHRDEIDGGVTGSFGVTCVVTYDGGYELNNADYRDGVKRHSFMTRLNLQPDNDIKYIEAGFELLDGAKYLLASHSEIELLTMSMMRLPRHPLSVNIFNLVARAAKNVGLPAASAAYARLQSIAERQSDFGLNRAAFAALHALAGRENGFLTRWPLAAPKLMLHLKTATGSKPSGKWLKMLKEMVTPEMSDDFADLVLSKLDQVTPENLYIENFEGQLKGLLWANAICTRADVAPALTRFARDICFQQVPGVGMRDEALGNACVAGLGNMPAAAGVPFLARLLARIKYPNVRKRIEAALNETAERSGVTRGELDEMSVQTHDLNPDGSGEIPVGDGAALLAIDGTASVDLTWRTPAGKNSKSLPESLKGHADEVKAVKARVKEIEADLAVQPWRLQRLWLDERRWPAAIWQQRYAGHPLMGALSRRLIWQAQIGDIRTPGLWQDGAFRDIGGAPVDLAGAEITLWHPVGKTVAEVVAWRDRLAALAIVQPFKQAHREVYLVTDAERRTGTYSNRFAGHIIKQHQMRALALLNGWSMIQHTGFDGGAGKAPARLPLPRFGLIAEYWVEPAGEEYTHQGSHLYLATDQLRFFRPADARDSHAVTAANNKEIAGALVPVADVPAIVLSEVMRQCDLFVGVASIANDADWLDAGADVQRGHWRDQADVYWQTRSFGDIGATGETRRDLLQALLPSLAIGKVARIDGKFLHVAGKLRAYKIHLGSGNILMEPNDAYLCIVPKAEPATEKLGRTLPFEGDNMLSIILSKAVMLAGDDKIRDESILSQIRR